MTKMQLAPEEIACVVEPSAQVIDAETLELRKHAVVRSKRGVDKKTWKNLCFRIEPERAIAIKVHCVEKGIDMNVFMDRWMKIAGF